MIKVDLRELPFGVEIEFTGMTRERAAQICAAYFESEVEQSGGNYSVKDEQNRAWKFVFDSSIRGSRPGRDYKVELVTPICHYEDIPLIQELVRRLRTDSKMKVNDSCGIHIHVDGSRFDARTLRNLVNLVANKEDMIYRALTVADGRAYSYCQKTDPHFLAELNQKKPKTLTELKKIWYQDDWERHGHYHNSRYRCLNLHSFFEKGTVEFRVFNSTTHAGELKTAIQFVLAITAQALSQKSTQLKPTQSDNEKYTFRTWLLRLGMIGEEFATARKFLLRNLEGNGAWRRPEQAIAQRERLREAALQERSTAATESEEAETEEMEPLMLQ